VARTRPTEEPVRLFNVQKQQVAIMITPEDWFLRTFYPLELLGGI
jgi:hypothetical protein